MSSSPYPSCWAASAALLVCCAAPGAAPPAELQVTGDAVRARRGEAVPSAIYDGHTVRLRGARGEVLGLLVTPPASAPAPVALELADGDLVVASFGVHSVEVREPSTSMYGRSRGAGTYPEVLVPVDGVVDGVDAAFFDIRIAAEASPGPREGRLLVGERAIPVTVQVVPVTIDLFATPRVWVYYEPREISRAHAVALDSAEQLAWERRYADLFRSHGAYLATDLNRRSLATHAPLLEGIRFWPVWIDTSSADAIHADVRFWSEQLRGRGVTPFAIPVDEPRRLAARLRVREIGLAVDRAAPDPEQFALAVTDAYDPAYGHAVDVVVSPRAFATPTPPGAVSRRWTYNGRPPAAGSMIIDTDGAGLRTWGWIGFRYDVELWYAWEGLYFHDRYNDGAENDATVDPITFDQRTRGGEDYGNGDGLLAYPGALPSLRLKALRRGLQDRKLLEALVACGGTVEASRLARRVVPVALGAAAGADPSWPRDELGWEQARAELLDAAATRCRDVM